MKRIVAMLTAIAALAITAAGAQAAVVYEKSGKIYVTSNTGKGTKLLTAGFNPGITPDGQTVTFVNANDALFKMPVAGGASTAFGGGLTFCEKCAIDFSPDSTSLLRIGGAGELDVLPLDGSTPVRVATGVSSWASFSPDSKLLAFDQETPETLTVSTVPVAGGLATKLPADGYTPMWTNAGIVTGRVVTVSGNRPQFQIVLLDASGSIKRVLYRKTIKTAKELKSGLGIQELAWRRGSTVVTSESGKSSSYTLRLISTRNGKVKAQRKFTRNDTTWHVSGDGSTLLVTNLKGKLQAVNFKTGKRTTLVKKGVDAAFMN